MTDFTQVALEGIQKQALSPATISSGLQEAMLIANSLMNAGAVWPSANLAIYAPVMVDYPCTVYQMSIDVVTQSGNVDVGIYDELGNRLVSAGSTAVGAAGIQLFNITDTPLTPGVYWLAMCCDNITASFMRSNVVQQLSRVCGCQQQAVGAVTLPNPATFAAMAQAYVPLITAHCQATV